MAQMRASVVKVVLLGLVSVGCEGEAGPTGPVGPEGPAGPQGPGAPQAASIEVTPTDPVILADGFGRELTAVVRSSDGSVIPGAAITWTSEDVGVASLSPMSGATVDPGKVIATGTGSGIATITAMFGSLSAEATAACCFPVDPDAFFSVRSGTSFNTGNVFDTGADELFVEIPLDFPTLETVYVRFAAGRPSGTPDDMQLVDFNVATYAADGVADLADYGAGELLTTLTIDPFLFEQQAVDVTDAVVALKEAGATHLGVRFYGATSGTLVMFTPFVDGPFPDGS